MSNLIQLGGAFELECGGRGIKAPAVLPGDVQGALLDAGLIKDPHNSPVPDHYAMGGIHSRAWGFMLETSFYPRNDVAREHEPSGCMVADNRYLLRFVADTEANLYKEVPGGVPARFELYDYKTDPGERNNLIKQLPEKAEQLKAIWKRESQAFPLPVVWKKSRWEALMEQERVDRSE